MIRVMLIALAISSATLLSIFIVASAHPLTLMFASYFAPLTHPIQPSTIDVTGDRVCQLYIYDIIYAGIGPHINPPSDLYQYKISISELSIRYGQGSGFKNLSRGDIYVQVFEVDKVDALEVQRMIREGLRGSNYSQYLPIITSEGRENIVRFVEQTAIQKTLCIQTLMQMAGPNVVYFVQSMCNTTNPPSNGNVHVVEVCLRRDVELFVPTGMQINDTKLDRLVDLVANASLYNLSGSLLKEIMNIVTINMHLWSEARVESVVVLQPGSEHVLRALAFFTVFVSGIVLHYRFRPHEYAGFARFFRRLRQRIYRQ
jgi:hypothetical protein